MIIQDLIKISSISGEEQEIQEYIFSYLSKIKLGPFLVGGNVVVKISGQNKKKAVIFNSHVDTVPVGDVTKWEHNPFQGKIVDEKNYRII